MSTPPKTCSCPASRPVVRLGFGHAFAAGSASDKGVLGLLSFFTPPRSTRGSRKLRRPFGKRRDSPMSSSRSVDGEPPASPPSRSSPSANLALSGSRNHGQTRACRPPKKFIPVEAARFRPSSSPEKLTEAPLQFRSQLLDLNQDQLVPPREQFSNGLLQMKSLRENASRKHFFSGLVTAGFLYNSAR